MANTIDKQAAMKAVNPAEFAKVLGHTDGGKRVRARLRSNGVHVSKGDAFDAAAKQLLWDLFVEGKAKAADAKAKKSPKAKASK